MLIPDRCKSIQAIKFETGNKWWHPATNPNIHQQVLQLSVAATFKQQRNLERKGGSIFHPFLAVLSSKPVHHRIIECSGLKRTLKIIATGFRKKVGEIENIISYHLYPEEFLQITHKKKSPTTNYLFLHQRNEVL